MVGLKEIILVDNGSTNRELLQWYKDCPYRVLFLDNLGHKAPWLSGLIDQISTDLYVVTDPDLDLSDLPDDTLLHLAHLLRENPALEKVGLGLQTGNISPASPYYDHVQSYESLLQGGEVVAGAFVKASVDTTLAIHDRRVLSDYKICGVRTVAPYVARHIPWHVEVPDAEFLYYLDHANAESSSYKRFTGHEPMGALSKLYLKRIEGKVSTKWSSYFPIYEKWLQSFRDLPVRLLEIGVQNGGSLEIWGQYFPRGEIFIGCDVNPAIRALSYDDPRIQLVIGVASDAVVRSEIIGKSPAGFDVIIDDGSHQSLDTISNFINYFSLLKPGGIFIVEDMHCAYWPEYDGGFFNQRSAATFFKLLSDLVNIEHARGDFSPQQLFQTFFGSNPLPDCLRDGSIYSVAMYNSVYVIEKSSSSRKSILGRCVIVGNVAAVDDRVLKN
jgi:hypothetical protein